MHNRCPRVRALCAVEAPRCPSSAPVACLVMRRSASRIYRSAARRATWRQRSVAEDAACCLGSLGCYIGAMATVQLRGTNNRVFVLERGVLDQGALLAFTGSQCHGLGLAIRKQTGWPLVAVATPAENASISVSAIQKAGSLTWPARTPMTRWRARAGAIRDVTDTDVQRLHAQHGWVPRGRWRWFVCTPGVYASCIRAAAKAVEQPDAAGGAPSTAVCRSR